MTATGIPRWVRCWADGGVYYRNPSPRGVYWSFHVDRGEAAPVTVRGRRGDLYTNNEAEWEALRQTLLWLRDHCADQPVVVYSDSRLIVNQFNGTFACNDARMRNMRAACTTIATGLKFVAVKWCPRHVMVAKLGH